MAKVIQVRNVPDEIHADLRARAAAAGKSLSDYVLDELHRIAQRSKNAEVIARALSRPNRSKVSREAIVAAINDGRRERDRQLMAALGFDEEEG